MNTKISWLSERKIKKAGLEQVANSYLTAGGSVDGLLELHKANLKDYSGATALLQNNILEKDVVAAQTEGHKLSDCAILVQNGWDMRTILSYRHTESSRNAVSFIQHNGTFEQVKQMGEYHLGMAVALVSRGADPAQVAKVAQANLLTYGAHEILTAHGTFEQVQAVSKIPNGMNDCGVLVQYGMSVNQAAQLTVEGFGPDAMKLAQKGLDPKLVAQHATQNPKDVKPQRNILLKGTPQNQTRTVGQEVS